MRLVGATPRQIDVISTVEASVAALCGVATGFGLFYAIRGPLTDVAFTGQRFAPGDLSLSLLDILVVALGVPIAAAASARLAMRRARISPLGVNRRVTPRRAPRVPPRTSRRGNRRAGVLRRDRPPKQHRRADLGRPLGGHLGHRLGLIIAGPWLTMAGRKFRGPSRPAPGHPAGPAGAWRTTLAARSARSAGSSPPCSSRAARSGCSPPSSPMAAPPKAAPQQPTRCSPNSTTSPPSASMGTARRPTPDRADKGPMQLRTPLRVKHRWRRIPRFPPLF